MNVRACAERADVSARSCADRQRGNRGVEHVIIGQQLATAERAGGVSCGCAREDEAKDDRTHPFSVPATARTWPGERRVFNQADDDEARATLCSVICCADHATARACPIPFPSLPTHFRARRGKALTI